MAHLLKQVEGLAKREGVSFCLVSPVLSTVHPEGVHFVRAFWSPHGHWSQMPVSIVFHDCKCFFCEDGSYYHCTYFHLVQSGLLQWLGHDCIFANHLRREKEMSAVVGY